MSNDITLTNCGLCDATRYTNTYTNTITNTDTTNEYDEEDAPSVNSSDDETDGQIPEVREVTTIRVQLETPPTPPSHPSPQENSATPKVQHIMYLHTEDTTSSLEFLAACKAEAPKEFHNHCFQQDGTRHFTLMGFTGLTPEQAASISFTQQPPISLPLDIELTGFKTWETALALGCNDDAKERITQIMRGVDQSMLPRSHLFKSDNLHLSLYRRHRFDKTENSAGCERVREAMGDRFGGTVRGVAIRLKVVGSSYTDSADYRGE